MRQDQAVSVLAENARLQALVDGINAIVWTYDPRRALFTSINRYAAVLLGYPLEEWLTRPHFWLERVVHPGDRSWAGEFCARATSRGEDHAFEYRAVCADGRVLWLRDVVRVLPAAEHGVILHGVMHDITAAKQIEASLRTSELQFRQIAEHIPAVVWLTDSATGELLFVSPRFEEVWGMPRAGLQRDARACLQLVHPADQAWVAAAAAQPGEEEIEYRIVRPDGAQRWIASRWFGVRNDAGVVYRVACIARDITAQKEAELALRESHAALGHSEARFRSLIENASDLITVLSAQGQVLYQSPAVQRLLGYTPAERLHANTFELVHPEDQPAMRAALERVVEQPGATAVVRARYRHADGTYRLLEARSRNLLHDPAVGGLVLNTRDVTEQVQLEAQLRQAQKMEAVGRLAGGIAHDFNNLLSVIQGHADLLLDTLGTDPVVSEDLQQIREAAQRAASLTRQLLAFSRRQVLQPALVDADRMLRDLEKMLRRLIGEHVELELRLGAAGRLVHIDVGQFEQVAINLVINARDALGAGGRIVVATDSVARAASETDAEVGVRDFLRLRVTDTGPGIAADVLPHIFEPFFTTKDSGKGTGLGLATVYAIVDGAGGSIEVSTGQSAGTTFFVFLPSHEGAAAPAGTEQLAQTQRGHETILLVEDEDSVRALGRRVLERFGYQVLEARNGLEALEQVEAGVSIDLVITDVVMPHFGGRELGNRLRLLRPDLPVLYVSGYPVTTPAHEEISRPGERYLEKPFDPAALTRAVRLALDPVK